MRQYKWNWVDWGDFVAGICNLAVIVTHKQSDEIMTSDYLESVKKQFEYYKMLGDKTFPQLQDEKLFWQYNEDSNSIAIIVKHLWGNMLSRWSDFLTSDGEKEWRNRDAEFENDISTRKELIDNLLIILITLDKSYLLEKC